MLIPARPQPPRRHAPLCPSVQPGAGMPGGPGRVPAPGRRHGTSFKMLCCCEASTVQLSRSLEVYVVCSHCLTTATNCGRLGKRATLKAFRGSSHTGLLSEDRLIREVLRTANTRPWPARLGREMRFAWSDLKGLLLSSDGDDTMRLQQHAFTEHVLAAQSGVDIS